MRPIAKLWRRLYFLLGRSRPEREPAEEVEGRRESFGNEVWSWIWLDQTWQDFAYAVRVLRGARGFTLGAVGVLALGIGVNLSEFQILDTLIFHRLTIPDADLILQFSRVSKDRASLGFYPGAVEFYRAHNRSFQWLVSEDATTRLVVDGQANVSATFVPADYFAKLGIAPSWGRMLDERDSLPGAPPAAVLGHAYWASHMGMDPRAVGRNVRINNKLVRIAGVMPDDFAGLWSQRPAVWIPATRRPFLLAGTNAPQDDFVRVGEVLFGRLKPGVARAAGEAELTALTAELIRLRPRSFQGVERVRGEPTQESLASGLKRVPAIAIFIVMILLVLFSACANLGNMLLARGLRRQREIGIRLALGASRGRVVRQLMMENLLLALLGSVAGLVFGAVASHLTMSALDAPPDMKLVLRPGLFAAGLALALVSALAFGLPAALRTARPAGQKIRMRQGLVGIQVAVSCLLLIASGVLARNGIAVAAIEPAFDYRNMILVDPQLYLKGLSPTMARQRTDALATRLRALPGVDSITASATPPLSGRTSFIAGPGLPRVAFNKVAPSYFEAMRLGMVRGRTFRADEPKALVLSESAARMLWPNEDPLGKPLSLAGLAGTVTGVTGDSLANRLLAKSDAPEIYGLIDDGAADSVELIVHTRGDPAAVLRAIVEAAATEEAAPALTLMRTSREGFLSGQHRLTTLIGAVGAVASALASVGMFATVMFAVAQRRRELGIRLALGARKRHILGPLLGQNAMPMAIGIIAGVVLAAMLSRLVRSLIVLDGDGATQLGGFALGLGCFTAIAVFATLFPAARALRIDPSATLREE